MSDISKFESRTGKLTCTPSEIFDFVTDIRNFSQFIPEGASVKKLNIDRDSCNFFISPLGNVSINLIEKDPHIKVIYNGNVLQSNEFSLILDINKNTAGRAEVRLRLEAHLNPLLKMMAAKPIEDLLAKMVDEMEKFSGWRTAK
jgi:carbon monoxide dehydrogenase subunit G